jgi:surface antigen
MHDYGDAVAMRMRLFTGWARGAERLPGSRRLTALRLVVLWIGTMAAAQDVAAQADADEEYVGPLVNQALETEKSGVEVPWSNPATGSSGMILIERTFYRDPRTPCRDYRRTLERAGAPTVEIEGTGCRIGAGRWSLDEEEPRSVAGATAPAPDAGTGPAPTSEPAEPPEPEPAAGPNPPSCPAPGAAPVPCGKPDAVVDYTMPTKTEL